MVVNDSSGDSSRKTTGDGNRKFRILELSYPAHISHPTVAGFMLSAQSFHMWFEREAAKPAGAKTGGLSLTFDTEKQAKEMYLEAKHLVIDGSSLKIQAPKALVSAAEAEVQKRASLSGESANHPDVDKKLYIFNLLPSSDYDLLLAIFGRENLSQICVLEDQERKDGSKVAVLTFTNAAKAESARLEFNGFSVDDGQYNRPMRIIPFREHLQKLHKDSGGSSNSRVKKSRFSNIEDIEGDDGTHPEEELYLGSSSPSMPFGVMKTSSGIGPANVGKAGSRWSAQIISNSPKGSGGRSDWDTPQKGADVATVKVEISQLMKVSGTKWENISGANDLWNIVEQVAAEIGHCPEKKLMEAMMSTLEEARQGQKSEWLNRHLGTLITAWRKEFRSRYQSQLAQDDAGEMYTPVPVQKKAKSKHDRKDVIGLMGVGALLAGMSGGGGNDGGEDVESGEERDDDNRSHQKPVSENKGAHRGPSTAAKHFIKDDSSSRPPASKKQAAVITPQQLQQQQHKIPPTQPQQQGSVAKSTPKVTKDSSSTSGQVRKRKRTTDDPKLQESSSGSESSSEDSSSSSEAEQASKKKKKKSKKSKAQQQQQQQLMMMANMFGPMMNMMQGNRTPTPNPFGGTPANANMSPQAFMSTMQKMMAGQQQMSPQQRVMAPMASMFQQGSSGGAGGGANNPNAAMMAMFQQHMQKAMGGGNSLAGGPQQ